jgi:hypothetical protein
MKLLTIHRRRLAAGVLAAGGTLGLAGCSTSSAAGGASAGSNSPKGNVHGHLNS